MEFLFLSLIFMIGWYAGKFHAFLKFRALIQKFSNEDLKPLIEQNKLALLFVEQIGTMLYLYTHGENEFICQATTIEELAVLALDKNIHYAAVKNGDHLITFTNGKVSNFI